MSVLDDSVKWLESHAIPCPFHLITGCDCPGCGMQRSVFSLLRGDLSASLDHHPAGLLVVAFVLILAIHLKVQHRYTRRALDVVLVAVVLISLVQYAVRWMHGELCY